MADPHYAAVVPQFLTGQKFFTRVKPGAKKNTQFLKTSLLKRMAIASLTGYSKKWPLC